MRDDVSLPFVLLRKELSEFGVSLATEDIHPPEDSVLTIELNIHPRNIRNPGRGKRYVIISEPPCTSTQNWDRANYDHYHRVLTYNEAWVDNKKVFLLRFPGNMGYGPVAEPPFEKKNSAP